MKTIYTIILCCCVCVCVAQKKAVNHGFTLNGTINGIASGTMYLCYVNAAQKFKTDSAKLRDGHFSLKGFITKPTIAFISTVKRSLPQDDDDTMKPDGKNSTVFFLEPKIIKASLPTGDFSNGTFIGSYTQTQYATYTHQINGVANKYKMQADSIQALAQLDKGQKETAKIEFADIRNKNEEKILRHFLATYPKSYATAYLVSISHFKLDSLNLFYNRLPLPVKLSAYGKDIKEKISKKLRVAIGKKAPQFKQPTKAGDSIALADFKGKYVLLQFWSSVNNASRDNNRDLMPLYNYYKDKNFTILGISIDGRKTKALWEAAIEKDGLPWIQLAALKSNHNQAVLEYDVQSVPANFLIDPDGKIIATDINADKLNIQLQRIFK